ncbi:MAG: LysE family translocator [Spirochaetales bacterium]|nr:LysE family translocator [Spirochaetales bacterium]
MISGAFLITALVVVLIPGTGVIYTVSNGLSGGKRESLLAALGCTLGIIPHLAAGILGISALLHTSARIFQIVKIIGVLYLVYLGVDLIRNRNLIQLDEEKGKGQALKIIGKGILLNLLNPKLTLFFLSFLPQFLTDSPLSYSVQMIGLSLIFMVMTLVVFILYGVLANSFKQFLLGSEKVMQRIQQSFGVILIGFAAKLAVSES